MISNSRRVYAVGAEDNCFAINLLSVVLDIGLVKKKGGEVNSFLDVNDEPVEMASQGPQQ